MGLSQASYIDKVLTRFSIDNSKKGLLPFRHGPLFSKEQCPKIQEERSRIAGIPYASVVESLMYAMLCTRPNIYFAVSIVSMYQSNPGLEHWTTVKHILKHLRRTKDYMLIYGRDELIPVGYTDLNFMSDKDLRKLTSGHLFTLEGGAVGWRNIKHKCIADSTTEVKYIVACEAAKVQRRLFGSRSSL